MATFWITDRIILRSAPIPNQLFAFGVGVAVFVVGWFGGWVGLGIVFHGWRHLMSVMFNLAITIVPNSFKIFLMDEVVDCHRVLLC